jgi:hypothetical protein
VGKIYSGFVLGIGVFDLLDSVEIDKIDEAVLAPTAAIRSRAALATRIGRFTSAVSLLRLSEEICSPLFRTPSNVVIHGFRANLQCARFSL